MIKKCSDCNEDKDVRLDYYMCSGKYRSECKACTIKRNVKYQRETGAWKYRFADDEARKLSMRVYYAKNKEQFAKYRAEFKDRHPDYYRKYSKSKKAAK